MAFRKVGSLLEQGTVYRFVPPALVELFLNRIGRKILSAGVSVSVNDHGRSVRRQNFAQIHRLSVMPQPLQRVELPGLGGKDVDYHAAVVQQDPGAVPVALTAEGLLAALLVHGLLHRAAQGVDLGVGGSGGNDEIIRQCGLLRHLNDGDLLALLLIQGLGGNDG